MMMKRFLSDYTRARWPDASDAELKARSLQIEGVLYFPFVVQFEDHGGTLEDKILYKAILTKHLDSMTNAEKEITIQVAMDEPGLYLETLKNVLEPLGFAA